mmetsp:Transcript_19408/g.45144  ORF Transcript_19408/g.45144 Transcript_19408/m.45144 type:complete len:328 (-) Transcript_19408:485-1468(-)
MPIDYSKWDDLEVSSSSDEEEDGLEVGDDRSRLSPGRPRVTRLDAPSSVTFGGPGGSISAAVPEARPGDEPRGTTAAAAIPRSGGGTTLAAPKPSPSSPATAPSSAAPSSSGRAPPSWTDHGGFLVALPSSATTTGGGGETTLRRRSLYWSQDRYSVTLRLELSGGASEKVASVSVEGILPYRDRNAATATTVKPKLVAVSACGEVLLTGELPHPVHRTEDDDDEEEQRGLDDNTVLLDDWSIVTATGDASDDPKRFLTIVLYKAVPMEGLTLWWRRPIADVPEADASEIRGETSGGAKSREDFLAAWEAAHEQFREKRGTRLAHRP